MNILIDLSLIQIDGQVLLSALLLEYQKMK